MSPAAVVYPEVIAGLTHKPLPRRRHVVNNRGAVTEGRHTQTQISIKVGEGRVEEQELLIDTSLIYKEGRKNMGRATRAQSNTPEVCMCS